MVGRVRSIRGRLVHSLHAAFTIATMPALRASGNRSQASTTAAKAGSFDSSPSLCCRVAVSLTQVLYL